MRINAQSVVKPDRDAVTAPPAPRDKPKLAHWLWERDLDFREGGKLFGCSHTALVNYCKPFDDPDRRVPKPELMARIVAATGGEVRPASFYPEALNEFGPAGVEAVSP